MTSNKFHFRDVCENPRDGDFILAAFDASLPHLASIGSGGQWGTQPFSEKKESRDRAQGWIPASEAFRLGEEGAEAQKLYIAELKIGDDGHQYPDGVSVRTDEEGRRFVSVAAALVREHWWPGYLKKIESLTPILDSADADGHAFYLEVLISDFRTGAARKGVGAALVEKIKAYSQSRGAKVLFVDCWAGNDEGLVKCVQPEACCQSVH